jgi:hypothetical protein
MHSTRSLASLRLRRVVAGAIAALVVSAPAFADAATARLRWVPRGTAVTSGYAIFVRNAGAQYPATPVWTGNPAPAPDGSISTTVTYTAAPSGVNYFAVVARADPNLESALSQELHLGTPNPCRNDSCAAKTICDFSARPNGSPCDDPSFCNGPEVCLSGTCDGSAARDCADTVACSVDSCDEAAGRCVHSTPPGCCLACDSSDPCLADACSQGDCSAPEGIDIEVNRVRFMHKSADVKLAAKGRFYADPSIDPSATGATVEFRTPDGAVLYSSTIAPNRIKKGSDGGRYRFAVTSAQSKFLGNGVVRLDFRVKGDLWLVTLKAETPLLIDAFNEPTVTWGLRLGEACVRRMDMPCDQTSKLSVCR